MAQEFQHVHQTTKTVAEIIAMFWEKALFVPQYAADEEMNKVRNLDMLGDDMREFVTISRCKSVNDMICRSPEREIDLEHLGKRGPDQVQEVEAPEKRTKISDQLLRGQ